MTNVESYRKKKQAPQESEARLRQILDTVVAFVGRLTTEGVLIEANEPALRAANLSRKDVIGKPFWNTYWWNYAPEVRAQLRDAIGQAAAGETLRYDVDVRVADDSFLTIDFQIAPNYDDEGEIVELISSGIDITDRKSAEEKLRRSHATFFNMVQLAPFGVYIVDSDFRLAQVSVGAEKAFSNVDPLIGRDFEEAMHVLWPEPFASEAVARFRHTLRTGEPYHSAETTEQRADVLDVESYDWKIERVVLPDGKFGVVCYFYDLTQQKRAERALAESQTAYRLALQAARSGAWDWDIVNDQVAWSPEVGELLAMTPEQYPRTVAEFIELMHEDDRDHVKNTIQQSIETGSDDYEIECRLRRGDDGAMVWVRGYGKIERDGDGKALRIVGLASDIDELRRSQSLARERDRRIQSLLNSTAEGIYGIDLNGVCTFANPACARLLDYESADELIGRNMHYLVHHHHADGTPYPIEDCPINRSFKTGDRAHHDHEVYWRKDGSSFPVEYWSYPIEENDRIVGSVVTFFDVSDRKAAEQEIEQSAARLNLALEVGEMGIWDWDVRTGATEWSEYHYTLAGYELGEVIPSYEAWCDRVHPDDLPRVETDLDRAKTERRPYETAFRFLHPDETIVHVVARGRFFYDEAGEPVRMLSVSDNVSKLKAAEEHQNMLLGELNHRVKNTLATIQAMASHTLRSAPEPEDFRNRFVGRLRAIAAAHDLLTATTDAGARIEALIERQVGLYADGARQVELDGPDLVLGAASAHALGLALHEMTTNAAKHGALSRPDGKIDVHWNLTEQDGRRTVALRWREHGGPPVQKPSRQGFGSRLIEQCVCQSLAGDLDLRYAEQGLIATFTFPLETGP